MIVLPVTLAVVRFRTVADQAACCGAASTRGMTTTDPAGHGGPVEPAEPAAGGAWCCPGCGQENGPSAARCGRCERERPEPTGDARSSVCPACGAQNRSGASSCKACGWPFPTGPDERTPAAGGGAPVPGLYMGRDAALHDAATREATATTGAIVWTAVQVVCALCFVLFVAALLLGRARPPGGLGLVLLTVVLVIGARALWRFATGGERARG
jgi:hypothetical protein